VKNIVVNRGEEKRGEKRREEEKRREVRKGKLEQERRWWKKRVVNGGIKGDRENVAVGKKRLRRVDGMLTRDRSV
jgi:hypothetical protein